jgi:hypothetical protein
MRIRFALSIAIFAALVLCGWQFGATEPAIILPLNNPVGVPATIGLGVEDPIGLLTAQQSGNVTTYSDGNFQIQLTETSFAMRNIIRVVVQKASGEAFRLTSFSITARAPRNAIQGIWYPGADSSSTSVMVTDANYPIDDIADANYGIPYLAAASQSSRNVLAIGLGRQDLAVSIGGEPAGSWYEFRLKALTPRTATKFDESFYISADLSQTWTDVAKDYADWVDGITNYQPFPISARAYEPLYDTWYWSGDRVDERLYLDTAKLATELGIGLYLADSGWDTEEGEYGKWLAGKTGDYTPPPGKFTDLSQTFSEMRSAGSIGIDLWLQPFAVGRQSFRYASTQDIHIQLPVRRYASMGWGGLAYEPFALPLGNNLESVNLCPRMASTQAYLRKLFTEVATTYKPEGYWLDFIDGMSSYCIAPHTHTYALFGDGLRRSLQTIKDTILSNDPDAIVHFRARYANLNTKPFANIWQSGDSPGNFDQMRLNSIRLRPFSKGVVFAADQMYWDEGTPEAEVSKFIMTSVMIGVPAFGPTLLYSPPETLAMLKAWLSFYRENQRELATGKFSTFGQLAMPNHMIESETHTFAYIRNLGFPVMPAHGRTILLMNATNFDRLRGRIQPVEGVDEYSVQIYDRYLVAEPQEMRLHVDPRGLLNFNVAVQQGGMAVLTPVEMDPIEPTPEEESTLK